MSKSPRYQLDGKKRSEKSQTGKSKEYKKVARMEGQEKKGKIENKEEGCTRDKRKENVRDSRDKSGVVAR